MMEDPLRVLLDECARTLIDVREMTLIGRPRGRIEQRIGDLPERVREALTEPEPMGEI